MSLINLTLAKLRAQARSKSGVNAADYPNTLLDDQLNIGYAQLAVLLANLDEGYFEEQNVNFNLIARSGLYSLPLDFIAMRGLRLAFSGTPIANSAYVVASSYDPVDVHNISIEESTPISNPIYDLTNNYMRIKPRPANDVTNGGKLAYIAMPSALTASASIPVIPIAYQDKIAVFGAMQMAFRYEKFGKHTRLANEWNTTMAELQDRLADRDRNAPVRFKSIHESGANRGPRELS